MTVRRAIDLACLLGLVALVLIVFSVVHPSPVPVFLAMTVGQIIGTLSFGLFVAAVIHDLRRSRVLAPRHGKVTPLDERIPMR